MTRVEICSVCLEKTSYEAKSTVSSVFCTHVSLVSASDYPEVLISENTAAVCNSTFDVYFYIPGPFYEARFGVEIEIFMPCASTHRLKMEITQFLQVQL